MKKTLIVAAVSALSAGAAFAQSSVTIYGRFNVSAESQKNFGAADTQKVLQNSASRIGFLGSEDLGGGMKAGFQLEHGFNVDTGTQSQAGFWARQAEVNLSGAFGKVRLGTMTSAAYYATADYVSMHNHDTGTSSDALYAYLPNNTNKIAYVTPEFVKNMTIEVAVTAGEGKGPRAYDAAWNYNVGGLALGAGYQKVDSYGANSDAKQFGLRALYAFGPFIVGGYYQRDTNGFGSNFGDRNTYRLSGAYMLGASEFHLNYGHAADYSKVANSAAKQYTVAYNYNLSKRTKVYAFYTKVDNGAGVNYLGFGSKNGDGTFVDPSSIAFGIRHNF